MAKARRSPGDGSVFQRKDKRWVVQIELEDGKRKTYYVKSKQEGKDKLKKLQREIEQGTLVTGPQQTVKHYLEYWLEEVHKPNIKVSTYVKYRKLIQSYIIPALGEIKLEKLTPQHVKSLYNQKQRDGLAPKTIHSIHGVLHKALDNAVLWNLVSRNVCKVVKPPRLVKTEKPSLTMEEAHKLLKSIRGHRLEVLLTLALTTGMRRGEILALRWSDIDFKKKLVRVRRTVDYIPRHGYVENEPKTAAGRRSITLADFVLDRLKQHRTRQLEAKSKAGPDWEDRNLVFTDLTGGYFNSRYLEKLFPQILAEAGLPPMRFHDLRHSAATLLLEMGVSMKGVQEILGHSSYIITADTYTHVLPTQQPEAMKHWDEEFNSAGENAETDDQDDNPPGILAKR